MREVFDSDDVLSQLRQVQAIVTHLERFPVDRAKNILTQALDLQPMPTTRPSAGVWADGPPRFARTNEWAKEEGSDERH